MEWRQRILALESVHTHPAALLAVNFGAHVRGLHTHSPFTHTCIFTSSYSHVAQDPCANPSTQRQAFSIHTHTHTHTHTHLPHTLCSTPGSR